jgi:hypothetical protein
MNVPRLNQAGTKKDMTDTVSRRGLLGLGWALPWQFPRSDEHSGALL